MGVIVPAILPATRDELVEKLEKLRGLPIECVQIDAVDGRFASPATWPYANGADELKDMVENGESLPFLGQLAYEVDLMVEDPDRVIGTWIDAGASKVTIHVESTNYLGRILKTVQEQYGHDKEFAPELISFGLALNVLTDIAILDQYVDQIEYVQFMGIATIGRQGEPFDKRVLDKIRMLRKRHPGLRIQVDGGVSLSTAPELLDAGVSQLVVGSYLWNASNIEVELKKLEQLAEEYGIYS